MLSKVLIANRGAIACRILRTLRRLDIRSVAVYSEADAHALHVRQADEAVCIGGAAASDSYLRQDRIIAAAQHCGAQAIHPGYGFLSENAAFAAICEASGIAFVGPTPDQIREFGLKHQARAIAAANQVPMLPGSGLLPDIGTALRAAQTIGYPVMLKSTAGGGGIGMQQCANAEQLTQAFESVSRLAGNHFSEAGLFLEKFVTEARHIEVQIFGDGRGQVVALGERDCSTQRRNQKVIEETPAPGLTDAARSQLSAVAVRLGRAVNYRSAGTVEFVYDAATAGCYFLEVNTRLQVEHGVTEAVTGVDLVEWMLRVASGEPPDLGRHVHQPSGHAVQARLYAEDPARGFRPAAGLLSQVTLPADVRVDGWIETGTEIPPFYDPLLAKIIAHGATREAALANLDAALSRTAVHGIETNLDYLRAILADPQFRAGRQTTRLLSQLSFQSNTIEVLQAGTQTLVQDWPGRLGLWDVGVPPSGPMDALAFRLANRIVGNAEGAAALELTVTGPTLRFATAALIALTGADMQATLDDEPVPCWRPIAVRAGAVLRLDGIAGAGQRSYVAFQGGLNTPPYLGSQSTFTLGQFGGHAGRALRVGDVLRLRATTTDRQRTRAAPASVIPRYGHEWEIGVLEGPHAAPDFFTPADMAMFYATDWEVHYNSSRTGVRLIGPKPQWARPDGGEAGLHPSNIHDNAYAIGAIDFTGDMPVILGPDGPSLGGFVCPATVALAELWKVGQLRPGDRVRFRALTAAQAHALLRAQDQLVQLLSPPPPLPVATGPTWSRAILHHARADDYLPEVTIRQSGEDNLLVELGSAVLDLTLRFQVQALYEWLRSQAVTGIIDMTPGIRSLQIHFDARRTSQSSMLGLVQYALGQLPDVSDLEIPSRIVHLPLSWDDPATTLATQRYMQSVRADAPWCPSNIEFIRRINGLESIADVQRIVFEASYLVMGLGDVYLGAPVATPLDPRHRLVTTKYNPARTWTPENAVGIGGAYLCVYGMEGPGGYQFVGRTVQMWNRYHETAEFRDGKPWLLRCFDQLRFFPVSADELLRMRSGFPYGQCGLRIEQTTLRVAQYQQFLRSNAVSIDSFRQRQRAAFDAERERWRAAGTTESAPLDMPQNVAMVIPEDCVAVSSPVSGSVWQLRVTAGQRVDAGDELLVLESMKMEMAVYAEHAGEVVELHCSIGRAIGAGATLLVLRPDNTRGAT